MKKIKELRLSHNMTQQDLASILHVSHTTVSMWEKDASEASLSTLIQLSDYFHVSIDYLIGHSDIKNLSNAASSPVLSADQRELLQLYSQLSRLNQGRALERIRILTEEENRQAISRAAHESTNKISG